MPGAIIDSGALVAWFNRRDRHHARVRAYLDSFRGEFVTTWPVLVETVHLLPTRLGVAFCSG